MIKKFLSAVFGDSSDFLQFSDRDGDFLATAGEATETATHVSLATYNETGEITGVAGFCAPVATNLPEPSLLMTKGKDRLGVWLVEPFVTDLDQAAELSRALLRDESAGPDELCPLPGSDWTVAQIPENPSLYDPSELLASAGDSPTYQTIDLSIENPILDRQMSISIGANQHAKAWPTTTATFRQLLEFLSMHQVGEKDGAAILQGSVIALNGGKYQKLSDRRSSAVTSCCLMIFDVDTGENIDKVEDRLRALNLFAFIYTTHSHNGTTTKVGKDKVLKWAVKQGLLPSDDVDPSKEHVLAYLAREKRIAHYVMASARVDAEQVLGNDGASFIVHHVPLPKYRVVLPLEQPFNFTNRQGARKRIEDEWKGKYRAVGNLIKLTFDRTCTDPARLLFTPRHPKGRNDWQIRLIDGSKCVDLDQIKAIGERADSNSFSQAGKAGADRKEYATPGMLAFAAKYANRFDGSEFLRHAHGGEIRGDDGNKVTVRCPNDDGHSDAGNPDDKGFFGSVNPETGGFSFHCSHDACHDLDRLDFLDLICQSEGLEVADLKDWCSEEVGDEEEPAPVEAATDGDYGPPLTFAEAVGSTIAEVYAFLQDAEATIAPERLSEFITDVAALGPNKVEVETMAKMIAQKAKGAKASSIITQLNFEVKQKSYDGGVQQQQFPPEVITALREEEKEFHVALMQGSLKIIRRQDKEDEPYEILDQTGYTGIRRNVSIEVQVGNEVKSFNIGKCFLDWTERKNYMGLEFEPDPSRARPNFINHWKGAWPITPVPGDWKVIQSHLFNITCRGDKKHYDLLLDYMAFALQYPGEKCNVALVVKGKEGTGKSLIFRDLMQSLAAPHFFMAASQNQISGQFNGHLSFVRWLVSEEAAWAGDKSAEGMLKALISETKLAYEYKGLQSYNGKNYCMLVILSNNNWAVPASSSNRRFFVLNPDDDKILRDMNKEQQSDYFDALAKACHDPDVQAAVMHDLMMRDIGDWSHLRRPPRTKWLDEQKRESLQPDERFFIDMIDNNGLDGYGEMPAVFLPSDANSGEIALPQIMEHFRAALRGGGAGTRRMESLQHVIARIYQFLKPIADFPKTDENTSRSFIFPPLNDLRQKVHDDGFPVLLPDEILDRSPDT